MPATFRKPENVMLAGGDWGAMLSKALGLFHSNHCKGIHVNMVVAPPTPYNPRHMLQMANAILPYADQFPIFVTAQEISWLNDTFQFQKSDTGKPKSKYRVQSINVCAGVIHLS